MSVETKRVFRFAGCCLLALFAVTAAQAQPAEEGPEFETYYDSEIPPAGILCTDDMIEEPYSDELEPTPVAVVEGCAVPELPVSA